MICAAGMALGAWASQVELLVVPSHEVRDICTATVSVSLIAWPLPRAMTKTSDCRGSSA